MKKITKLFAISLFSILLLTGCGTSVVTQSDFREYIEETDYEYQEYNDGVDSQFSCESAIAVKISDNAIVEFYVFEDNTNSINMYNAAKENIEEAYTSKVTTFTNVGNKKTFTCKADDEYYRISSVGNTLLYGYTNNGSVDEINKVFDNFKY